MILTSTLEDNPHLQGYFSSKDRQMAETQEQVTIKMITTLDFFLVATPELVVITTSTIYDFCQHQVHLPHIRIPIWAIKQPN